MYILKKTKNKLLNKETVGQKICTYINAGQTDCSKKVQWNLAVQVPHCMRNSLCEQLFPKNFVSYNK